MTGGPTAFPARIQLQNPGAGQFFSATVCFSRKTHRQPSAPRKLIFGACGGLCFFSKFFGACGGLCFFKNVRRLRRALFFFKICRRLRRALFSKIFGACGGFFFQNFRRLRRALFFSFLFGAAEMFGACGGLRFLLKFFGACGGLCFSFFSAPAAGSCLSFVS